MTHARRPTDLQRAALLIIPTLAGTIAELHADLAKLDADMRRNRGERAWRDSLGDISTDRQRAQWRLDGALLVLDVVVRHARRDNPGT